MPRPKHRKDYNGGKRGWVMGNPRYGKKGKYRSDGVRPTKTREHDKREFQKVVNSGD